MSRALWAEWIIARFTDRARAASTVGDVLEIAAQRGISWFWLCFARIVFSLIWRRTIAFVAALYLGLHALGWFQLRVIGIRAGLFGTLLPLGTLLWIVAPYAAVRYGLRDKFAQLSVGFCGLITICAFYWWIPIVTAACIALALFILIGSILSAQGSKALAALAVVLVLGFWGGQLSFFLEAVCTNHFYMNSYVICCFYLLAVWITTTACAWMYNFLLLRDQRGAENQSPT